MQAPAAEEVESRNAQIKATLYGQCIGDAIGLLTEFLSKKEADAVSFCSLLSCFVVCNKCMCIHVLLSIIISNRKRLVEHTPLRGIFF